MKKFDQIIQEDKLVLVDFFATWCGPCQMLAPVLEQVKKQLNQDITILKIDVDKNAALTTTYSTKYNFRGVPTLLLFKQGKVLFQQSGFIDAQTLLNKIEQYKNNY